MIKFLVETTGPFNLYDFNNKGAEIHANRPTVVERTEFINQRGLAGQLRGILDNVPDYITDEDFGKFWAAAKQENGTYDRELAIDSFEASFGPRRATPEEEAELAEKERQEQEKRTAEANALLAANIAAEEAQAKLLADNAAAAAEAEAKVEADAKASADANAQADAKASADAAAASVAAAAKATKPVSK